MKQVSPSFGLWALLLMLTITATAQPNQQQDPTFQRTLRNLEQQIRLYPHDPDLRIDRADLLMKAGYFRQAVMDYARARSINRGEDPILSAMTWYKQAICEYLEGDFTRADNSFSQAIREEDRAPHPWYFRGKIRLLILDDPTTGLDDLRRSLELAEKMSVQTFVARYLTGDVEGAFGEYEELLDIAREEDNREAIASIQYQLATLYALTGNAEATIVQLRKAMQEGFSDLSWLSHDPSFMPLAEEDLFRRYLDQLGIRYAHRYHPAWQPMGLERGGPSYSRIDETSATLVRPGDLVWGEPQFLDEDDDAQLSGGERAVLRIPLSNRGIARDALQASLDLDQAFGPYVSVRRLDPVLDIDSREATWLEWEIRAEEDLPQGQMVMRIEAYPAKGRGPAPLEISVTTVPLSGLRLEIPDHHFASEYGGDMEPGVPVLLRFAVQNTGELAAAEVEVHIDLPAGVFASGNTAFQVGNLIPGESSTLEFEFFTSRRFDAAMVHLPLTIWSNNRSWTHTDTLSVRMNSPLEVAEQVVIRPRPRRMEAGQIQLTSAVDKNLPRALSQNPNALAIVIGNRDYAHPDVPVVDYALKDAASMRRYLIESFGFTEENVIFLTNASQADFYGLFGTANDYQARLYNLVRPGITEVFIFYSGHGAPDPETQTGYFLPVDCDPTLVRFNGYPLETFYNNLSKVPFKSLTVVMDACFSGNSEQGSLIQQASPVRIKTDNPILRNPNAWVLTAAASDQIASWNQDEQHGLFTWLMLKGIQGAGDLDQNGSLTFGELREYLSIEVPQQARRLHNRYQTPDVYGLNERTIIRYR